MVGGRLWKSARRGRERRRRRSSVEGCCEMLKGRKEVVMGVKSGGVQDRVRE
jgi:hypothetical protein